MRAIRDTTVLQTSFDYIVRDYLHQSDFFQLFSVLLAARATNTVVDCYSKAPIDKPALLAAMQDELGLQYETRHRALNINETGGTPHYYSLNAHAAKFVFQPLLTSMERLAKEVTIVLESGRNG